MDLRTAHTSLRTLRQRFRYKRHQKGWTQDQLALHAETNQAVIQKIENGKSLRPRKIDKIAEVLDVNPAWLMFGDQDAIYLSDEAKEFASYWEQLPPNEKARIKSEVMRIANHP